MSLVNKIINTRIRTNLTGKVALVTGSARGLGKVIATSLAVDGAKVVLNDIDEEALKKTYEELKNYGLNVYSFKADVSKWSEVKAMVDEIIRLLGKIDILINNAGIVGPFKEVYEITEEEWDRVISVNVKGSFLVTKAVVPYMIKQRYGRIIFISSVAGVEGNAKMSPYCASKAALIGLAKALAEELASYGIRVNAVAPALIEGTSLTEGMPKEQKEFLAQKIPIGRLIRPEEVADLVKFLVSDAADPITGYVYLIAGGRARAA